MSVFQHLWLEKIEVLHRDKDDKTFEIKLTFYVAKCLLAVSLENEYLNLLIINLTIKTSRNLIKGCNYLLDNLTMVRKDLLPNRFNNMNREWKRNTLFLVSNIQTVNIQYSDINIQTSIFNFQTSIFNIQTSIFILFSLFKQLWPPSLLIVFL